MHTQHRMQEGRLTACQRASHSICMHGRLPSPTTHTSAQSRHKNDLTHTKARCASTNHTQYNTCRNTTHARHRPVVRTLVQMEAALRRAKFSIRKLDFCQTHKVTRVCICVPNNELQHRPIMALQLLCRGERVHCDFKRLLPCGVASRSCPYASCRQNRSAVMHFCTPALAVCLHVCMCVCVYIHVYMHLCMCIWIYYAVYKYIHACECA
jgi:hypothetical protein